MRKGALRLAGLGTMALSGLIFLFLVYGWVHTASIPDRRRAPGLGNFEENVRALPPPEGGSFRFAVLGDPEEGLGVFRDLMRKAHAMGAAFAIIPGDVVDRPTRAAFDYFLDRYRSLGPAALPTFAAIGNHDESPEGFFEEYCGPERFEFVHGDSLFVFANNNRPELFPEAGRYLKEAIARHRSTVRHVFIVVHKPLIDFRREGGEMQEYRGPGGYLYDILDTEKVDAVLAAHFHGYLREVYRDTVLLVTGGAGSKLHAPDAFFHMVLIDVSPEGIRETVVKADGPDSFRDRLGFRLSVAILPSVFGAWWRPLPLAAGGAALLVIGLSLRRKVPKATA